MSRIEALRRIVAERQHAKVEGVEVDLFSASAMVAVFDAVRPDLQARFEELDLLRLAEFAVSKVK